MKQPPGVVDPAEEVALEPPPRPDVTLALLQSRGARAALVLSVSQAAASCAFELINLSSNPNADWRMATRVDLEHGRNWMPLDTERGQLVLSPEHVEELGAKEEHTLLIRQVRGGACSIQSLFKVSTARINAEPALEVATAPRARRRG
jgi:hypothetical protein